MLLLPMTPGILPSHFAICCLMICSFSHSGSFGSNEELINLLHFVASLARLHRQVLLPGYMRLYSIYAAVC